MSKAIKLDEFFFYKAGVLIPLQCNPVRLSNSNKKIGVDSNPWSKKVNRKGQKVKRIFSGHVGFSSVVPKVLTKSRVKKNLNSKPRLVKGPKISKKLK